MGPRFRGDDEGELLVLHRLALDEGLAALHLVGERRLVDLDHDHVGVDAEVFHQRLRDVAPPARLLFIGAAGGHAEGDFMHCWSLPLLLLRRRSCHSFDLILRSRVILHRRHHLRKRMIQYSAPVMFNVGVTAYWMPAFAVMTTSANSTSLHVYQESCGPRRPAKPAAPWSGPRPASADIPRGL